MRVFLLESVDGSQSWRGSNGNLMLLLLMRCRERKNVNLPGVIVDLPTLTAKVNNVEIALFV